MKRAATLLILLVLATSSLVGAIGLSVGSPTTGRHVILPPLQFQLNGRDPYVIRVPMKQGETISGEVNATGGSATFSIVLRGVVMYSEFVSGSSHYEFTASATGTYDLVFDSAGPAMISMDVYSPR